LVQADQPESAEQALRKALALSPTLLEAHQALIQLLYDQGRWDAYEDELNRFQAVVPTSPFIEYERGHLSLLRGNLREGWRQLEARFRVPGYIPPEKRFPQPWWDGQAFAGKTLLVHFEQGFGDTLMFVRYLPLVKARGGRVVLLVQPQFAYLMTTLAGVDEVVGLGQPVPPFDLQVSLFSMPALFGTDLDSVPADIPYLGIPKSVPNRWGIAETLAATEGRLRVGLVWGGNPRHPRDAQRSIPGALLNPLGVLPGVAWHSFQLGRGDAPQLPAMLDLSPWLQTFSDTAYALSGMDLAITVDTAFAHLAGALGVPTLLLLAHAPDFRWMLAREDTPWYPSLRLYRQPRPGDWKAVVDRLMVDLSG
jgi:hypothetical protein